jgi:hypothetical protein
LWICCLSASLRKSVAVNIVSVTPAGISASSSLKLSSLALPEFTGWDEMSGELKFSDLDSGSASVHSSLSKSSFQV